MSEIQQPVRQRNVTLPALLAMIAGFLLGLAARQGEAAALMDLAAVAGPVGTLWTNALRMVVLPLMVAHIILAINSVPHARTAGRIGGLAMVSFFAMLAAAGLFTITAGAELLSLLPIDESGRAAFRAMGNPQDIPRVAASAAAPDLGGWLAAIVPSNPIRAAVEENFVGVVFSTLLFALAVMRITPERRASLIGFFEAVAEASGVLVKWILNLLPIAAFALAYDIAIETGTSIAGSVGYFIAALSAVLIVVTLMLFPVTALLGRVSIRKFASSIAPALAVGAGTRSSLAALPSMLDAADGRLGVRREVAGFVLPLSVSTFKLSPVISQPFDLLFYIIVFGLDPSPALLLSFTAATFIHCFASPGIPSGSRLLSWPLFLAAGVPVEVLVLMKVVDAIPDIFKTMLNVTADMSIALIVQRFHRDTAPRTIHIAPAT